MFASIELNVAKCNPVHQSHKTVFALKNKGSVFGLQKGLECRKLALLMFTNRKDIDRFSSICLDIQKQHYNINNVVLEDNILLFQPMHKGDRFMIPQIHAEPLPSIENICILHHLDLIVVHDLVRASYGKRWSLNGVEHTFDVPPPAISARILNRVLSY